MASIGDRWREEQTRARVAVGALLATAAALVGVQAAFDPPPIFVLCGLAGLVAVATYLIGSQVGRARLARVDDRAEAILAGIGEAIVVTDPTGSVERWNRAATTTFGCPGEEAVGRSCHDALGLVHEVRELDCSAGCALLPLSRGGVDVEVWRRYATGTRQPLLASVSPVLDDAGEIVEVVHSFRDITRLKQADEAKSLFLATASHELKTPLTVIQGFSQVMLLPDAVLGEDDRRAALKAIEQRAGQLSGIVDRLLLSSRIEAGRIDLDPVAVAPAALLRSCVDTVERATGREIALDLDEGLPDAWCDPDALTTVVEQLLDNAVKYSPGGGPVRLLGCARPEGVELVVRDEGIGMSEEEIRRCFERFWQAETTDVRRFGGTGIGLYVVRALVEGMGGAISVASTAGSGTSVRVVLRRAPADAPVHGR